MIKAQAKVSNRRRVYGIKMFKNVVQMLLFIVVSVNLASSQACHLRLQYTFRGVSRASDVARAV